MMYDRERIYAIKWQHVVESAVNEKTRKIVENQLEEGSLSTAQIARFCELEIEDVEKINDALKQDQIEG